jgi:hypothetical protein
MSQSRRPNRLVIDTGPRVMEELLRLTNSGLFGATVEDTAEELLRRAIRDVLVSVPPGSEL